MTGPTVMLVVKWEEIPACVFWLMQRECLTTVGRLLRASKPFSVTIAAWEERGVVGEWGWTRRARRRAALKCRACGHVASSHNQGHGVGCYACGCKGFIAP